MLNKENTSVTIKNSSKIQKYENEVPMFLDKKRVIGPMGKQLTLEDLPTPKTKRWVIRRKAEVVAGVKGGLLSLDEASRQYSLTVDEFKSWQLLLENHGVRGLRITKIKKYRQSTTKSNRVSQSNNY